LIEKSQVFNEVIYNEDSLIHQGTFFLAEEAKIGLYTIRVIGRNSATCTFSVEEYVLPKFGVEIEGLRFLIFYVQTEKMK
jgi:uncharacterized protein YfaS (alpha-2-macroglobulin family)